MNPSASVGALPWEPRVPQGKSNAAQAGFAHSLHLFGVFWIVYAIARHPILGVASLAVAAFVSHVWKRRGQR